MKHVQRRQCRVAVLLVVLFAWMAADGAFAPVRAELSRQFREQLQRQYESGHIPDATRNMPYEERLAIKKKQQKLEEEQRQRQVAPPPARPSRERDRYERSDRSRRETSSRDRRYRHCEDRWQPGSWEFNRCLRGDSREMIEDSRYRDRYDRYDDRSNRYDRYDRDDDRYYDGRPWRY